MTRSPIELLWTAKKQNQTILPFLSGGLSEVAAQPFSKYLDAGARVASFILANDNDVKSDFEVLSQLTSTILSSDVKETELGWF